MQFLTVLLSGASLVAANTYTLYCGSSCDDVSNPGSTGSDYSGASCTAFETSQAYCAMVSDETFYKAIVSAGDSCEGGDDEQVIWPGECFEGPWDSFQVVVSL